MKRFSSIAPLMLVVLTAACCTASVPEDGGNSDDAASPPKSDDANAEEAVLTADGENAYAVEGAHDFTGRLTFADGTWTLTGTFTFPTAGYSVGEPQVMMLKRYPVHVNIRIPVTPPPKDALVAQVITEEQIQTTVSASADATFSIFIETNRNGDER